MADSVDIVIGAKDQATKILDDVGRSVNRMASSVSAIAAPLAAVGAAFAAFKGTTEFFSFLGKSGSAFGDSEEANRKLAKAIELSGESAAASMPRHVALADAMLRKFNIDDETTKGLMAQASMMGIADDKLDEVTKTAIGLSEAMGVSLEQGLKSARLAMDGNFNVLSRLSPAVRAAGTEEEKFAAMLELAQKGLLQKADAANSASQADERAMLAIGEFMESVGQAILPLQAMAYEGIGLVVDSLNIALGPAIKSAGEYFGSFKDTVLFGAKALATGMITVGTFIEVAWNKLGSVFEIVGASVLLSIETLRADIEQALTVAIPAYAVWFADNFFNIMRDVSMAVVTVFSNLGAIIGEIFGQVWLVITGQQSIAGAMEEIGRAAGRGLLDGFEATTKPMPEIAARAMTATELAMNQIIDTNSKAIASDFGSKLEARLQAVNDALAPAEKDDTAKLALSKKIANKSSKASKGESSTESILTATESRLLSRGRVEDPSAKVAQNTQRMIEQNEELRAAMDATNQRLEAIQKNTEVEIEGVE
jgi:hypothetical protein